MTSTGPPPDPRPERARAEDPHLHADDPGDLRRIVPGLVLPVTVLAVTVPISRCGPDEGPSGGDEPKGLPVVTSFPSG